MPTTSFSSSTTSPWAPGRCTAQSRWASPLGEMLLVRTAAGLAGVLFDGQKWQPDPLQIPEQPDDPLLTETAAQLGAYFAGRLTEFDLPLDLHGTPFQTAVWHALRDIRSGQTRSYADIAQTVERPAAVRAVGAAVGRNPVSIVVPCHRVIGRDGSLTGYAGGLLRKTALLQIEGVLVAAQPELI